MAHDEASPEYGCDEYAVPSWVTDGDIAKIGEVADKVWHVAASVLEASVACTREMIEATAIAAAMARRVGSRVLGLVD